MGIDKPDVRYIVHFDLPKSMEGEQATVGVCIIDFIIRT